MNNTVRSMQKLSELPDFFTAAEPSQILGISKATAYRRVSEGQIPCFHIGKRVIISRTHLLNWLDREITMEK